MLYSTAYLSASDMNDTRFLRPGFDKMVIAARAELNEERRKQMYHDIGMITLDDLREQLEPMLSSSGNP